MRFLFISIMNTLRLKHISWAMLYVFQLPAKFNMLLSTLLFHSILLYVGHTIVITNPVGFLFPDMEDPHHEDGIHSVKCRKKSCPLWEI